MTGALPTPLSRFFGRAEEAAAVRGLLEVSRLVTVTGPPGGGKTRLAVEVAAELGPRFRDGARFIDLTSAGDDASVPAAIASALGVAEQPGTSVTDTVVASLATAELLVILDNCEHLVRAAAAMTAALLAGCPGVRVLATSRVALGIAGEQRFPLPPLASEPSVALFTDRARLVRPAHGGGGVDDGVDDQDVDDPDQRHIEQICRRVDGLPLAIELAAAWSRVLSPGQILHRLEAVLPMLVSGTGPASRQDTMDATVAWSHRLLTSTQQTLFEQLSVFSGGFDLAAAEAVTDRGPDVLDDLTALVDHSLVLTERSGPGMRYRLLEPVRQYGAAALARREDAERRVRTRHAEHYLAVAVRGDSGLRHADVSAHLLALCAEEGNLLAAIAWGTHHDRETALRIATALGYFWELRAVNEGRARLAALLDGTRSTRADGDGAHASITDERLLAAALSGLGALAWRQQDNEAAREYFTEVLAIMRGLGDQRGIARGLRNLALTASVTDDAATAVDLCEQALRLLEEHGDDYSRGWTWSVLALAKYAEGDWAAGERLAEQALEAGRREGSIALEVAGHMGITYSAAQTGDVVKHRRHLSAVLTARRDDLRLVDDPEWLWSGCGLAANEGRTRATLRLGGAAHGVHGRGSRLPDSFMASSEAALARARGEVGARAAERFMAEGATMTTERLMAEVLARPDAADRPLSAREREVAGLVGDGLTNEQIATRLVLSRRTVETHVDRVKQKLGLSGRNAIMAWVIGRRMEDEQAE